MTQVQDLLRPEAYPVPPEHVELVQTHISWVFLAGGAVYKVKRPVDYGFLDFRSLRQRHEACNAEVTLNRRLAPRVYVRVVPVRRDATGSCHIAGDGEIVDWAVEMIRLPVEHRADSLLLRGALTGEHIDALADRLAAFHAQARCDAETNRFGRIDAIACNVRENFVQTAAIIHQYLSPAEAREIEERQASYLVGHVDLFEDRIAKARVRDGHGDLRLEHAYIEGDRIDILDCIEFSDRFRFADVCADVAFLSMDLAWHGRVDLAERFLARYARSSNDYDLYALVDFYEGYRAYVRAKVSMLLVADAASTSLSVIARKSTPGGTFSLRCRRTARRSCHPSWSALVGSSPPGRPPWRSGWVET